MFKISLRSILKNHKPLVKWFSCVVNKSAIVDEDLAKRLETVSLVGFSEHNGYEVLSASVKFADRITSINTNEVQPLITVLENWDTDLRNDLSSNKITRRNIMRNALVVEEDYFVTPTNKKLK